MTSTPVKGWSILQVPEPLSVTRHSHFTPGLTAACTPPLVTLTAAHPVRSQPLLLCEPSRLLPGPRCPVSSLLAISTSHMSASCSALCPVASSMDAVPPSHT